MKPVQSRCPRKSEYVQRRILAQARMSVVWALNLNCSKAWSNWIYGEVIASLWQSSSSRVTRPHVYPVMWETLWRGPRNWSCQCDGFMEMPPRCLVPTLLPTLVAGSRGWKFRQCSEMTAELSPGAGSDPESSAGFLCRCRSGWCERGSGGSSGEKPCWSYSRRQRQPSLPLCLQTRSSRSSHCQSDFCRGGNSQNSLQCSRWRGYAFSKCT